MAKVFIIAGHGAGDSGAVGGGLTEADLVRRLSARMRELGGSDVEVGDTSVNWYASDYISKGRCPKGVPVVELHMDSGASGAKGGHVIIKAGIGGADSIDRAIESFIKGFFPGRSVTMSERADLANPNRAYRMGVNYRLVECGFISNDGDRNKFLTQMDDLARGLLSAFGVQVAQEQPTEPERPAEEPTEPQKPLPEALSGYVDVDPEAWYVEDLAKAVESGIISGYDAKHMGPADPVTRAQAVCMIARFADAEFEHPFSDVIASPFYYDAVAWAKELGIVAGMTDEEFGPDEPCARCDLAVMVWRWAGRPGATEPDDYEDWGLVPEYAKEALAWCVETGIMTGTGGRLRPTEACSRVEAAIVILRTEE